MNLEPEIINIVAKQAKAEAATLSRDTELAALNLQSIDVVELVFAIEEKYDIEVPYAPGDQYTTGISFKTVGDIVDGISKLVTEQHPEKMA